MSASYLERQHLRAEQLANPERLLDERDVLRAERERMLDLLERVRKSGKLTTYKQPALANEIDRLLRQAGRNQPKEA